MRRRRTTGAAIFVAIAAIGASSWGLSKWKPFEHDTAAIDWPTNVQSLVDYIQRATGLQFRESIEFSYIADLNEYNEAAGDVVPERSADDLAEVAIDEAIGRALGLWSGDTSLIESFDTVSAAAPRPARWRPADNLMLIHARDEAASLRPAVRADLVVYLTQALIEQNFHLIEKRQNVGSSQEYDALAAIHIGFALWVHDEYVGEFTTAERAEFDSVTEAQSEDYVESVESVPATFKAIRIAFQVLGPPFITALIEDDLALAVRALDAHIPTALDQISLPAAKYLRDDATEFVAAPVAPEDAIVHFSDQLGPFRLFLMFATGLPANEALTAADGWGNDRFTAYELAGRHCVDVHIVADSPVDADRLERALNGWAFVRPAAGDALVGRDGVDLYASACDPGTDARQAVADDNDIQHYFARADMLLQQAAITGKPALAECIATEFFAAYTFEQIQSALFDGELEDAFVAIEEDCRNTL